MMMKPICLIFLFSALLFGQPDAADSSKVKQDSTFPAAGENIETSLDTSQKSEISNLESSKKDVEENDTLDWFDGRMLAAIVAFLGLLFTIYRFWRNKETVKEEKLEELITEDEFITQKETTAAANLAETARERYQHVLEDELGSIKILGLPQVDSIPVATLDTFVALDISTHALDKTRKRFDDKDGVGEETEINYDRLAEPNRRLNPDEVIERAFRRDRKLRMLLITGDPGSGKTTLMKYYAMTCLNGNAATFGLAETTLPLFLPLREIDLEKNLAENLAAWKKLANHDIPVAQFEDWLRESPTLVLLDGLDEVSDLEKRRQVCEWISNAPAGLKEAYFVVTSRWTGMRKLDGIEITFDHLNADVQDFSPEKQADFLKKWFCAIYCQEEPPAGKPADADWQRRKTAEGESRAAEVIEFLQKEENKRIRELAAVTFIAALSSVFALLFAASRFCSSVFLKICYSEWAKKLKMDVSKMWAFGD